MAHHNFMGFLVAAALVAFFVSGGFGRMFTNDKTISSPPVFKLSSPIKVKPTTKILAQLYAKPTQLDVVQVNYSSSFLRESAADPVQFFYPEAQNLNLPRLK